MGDSRGVRGQLPESIRLDSKIVFGRVVDILKIFWGIDYVVFDSELLTLYAGVVPQICTTGGDDFDVLLEEQETLIFYRVGGEPSVLETSRTFVH